MYYLYYKILTGLLSKLHYLRLQDQLLFFTKRKKIVFDNIFHFTLNYI